MTSLPDGIQADIIETFNSTSRYLDNLLNIDNPYFKGMVNIYPPELILQIPRSPFGIHIYLFLTALFLQYFWINAMTLIYIL